MTAARILTIPVDPTHRRRVIIRDGRALVVHDHLRDHHGHALWCVVRVDPSVHVDVYAPACQGE